LKKLKITTEELKAIIFSHGWYALKPIIISDDLKEVIIPYELKNDLGFISIVNNGGYSYHIQGNISIGENILMKCLSLDTQLNKIYKLIEDYLSHKWIIDKRLGRFLKSPSLFEDCCKIILSTNTTWNRTVKMVEELVNNYGKCITDSIYAFPTPMTIFNTSDEELRKKTGCGFRSRYLLNLAEAALSKDEFI